jgi:DNA-binding FrmR family transcriptional regulator
MIEDIKKRALHRTKILEGQIRGLQKMIESEDYCVDIITQSIAIQKSLGSLNKLLVENHLKTHVKHALRGEDSAAGQPVIDELVKIFELSSNRGSAK